MKFFDFYYCFKTLGYKLGNINSWSLVAVKRKADFAKKRLAEARLTERNRKIVERFNALSGTRKVVDFGTGDGEFLSAYQEKHPEGVIIGFDPFSYTAEELSNIPEGVVVCDAAGTEIYPDSVDIVTINMPDPWQTRKLMPRFIKEAWRILKIGGVICIVFECPDFIFPVTKFTIQSSTTDIVSSLSRQGFQIEHEGVPLQEIDSHYPKTKTMELCEARYGGCTLFKGHKSLTLAASKDRDGFGELESITTSKSGRMGTLERMWENGTLVKK